MRSVDFKSIFFYIDYLFGILTVSSHIISTQNCIRRSIHGWHVLMTIPNETSWINFKMYSLLDGDLKRISVRMGSRGNFLSISCSSFNDTIIFSTNSTDLPNGPRINISIILFLLFRFTQKKKRFHMLYELQLPTHQNLYHICLWPGVNCLSSVECLAVH